jgi:uroporphyrinogen decarboxylase
LTGKENYKRAIEFQNPEYLPCDMYADLNYIADKDTSKQERIRMLEKHFPDDLIGFIWCWIDRWEKRGGITYKHDEWGTEWIDDGKGLVTCGYPLEEGYHKLDGYTFPDIANLSRFKRADELIASHPDHYIIGTVWFTLWERLWMLRGMENMFVDYLDYPDEFEKLKGKILEINLAILDEWLKRDIDAIYFSDDWGGQRGMLISPDQWRRQYRDDYKRMFTKVRDAGKHVWLHSCGNVTDIIPDLIDLGVNVLNPVQPQAMDVDRLAREFGGHICFNGGVDVQGTMIHGNPEDIRGELRHLNDIFGRFSGGYIANTSHSIMPETPLGNVIALFEAYLELAGRQIPA